MSDQNEPKTTNAEGQMGSTELPAQDALIEEEISATEAENLLKLSDSEETMETDLEPQPSTSKGTGNALCLHSTN